MTISVNCIYHINKSNINYINALARYGKRVFLDSINGKILHPTDSGYSFKCSDLSTLIPCLPGNKFSIKCSSGDSDSTFNVFPSLDPKILRSETSEEMCMNTSEFFELNSRHIFTLLQEKNSIFSLPWPPETGANINLGPLNQNDAILLTAKILEQDKNKSIGTMLFFKHQIILFQFDRINFLLKYGKNSSLNEMSMLVLDMDEGFSLGTDYYTADDKLVVDELQELFNSWKDNNYEGVLIPAHKSGFHSYESINRSLIQSFYRAYNQNNDQMAVRAVSTNNQVVVNSGLESKAFVFSKSYCPKKHPESEKGLARETSTASRDAIPMHETPSLSSSQNVNSFWRMPSKAVVLSCVSAAALATVAGISYVNKIK